MLLACAIASRNAEVREAFGVEAAERLTPEALDAARAAAAIMAMNNVYYRAVHLASNKEYAKMPARLRMNVIGSPGVPRTDFELWCLAVSAINGCGACVDLHEKVLRDAGVSAEAVHAALRYAAIVQSAAVALEASAGSRKRRLKARRIVNATAGRVTASAAALAKSVARPAAASTRRVVTAAGQPQRNSPVMMLRRKFGSCPPVGVVRETKSNTLPSFMP